ncbi:MAG: beta-phosphoglucomutase [Candidatus Scalindua rubra]|uniref:Beta-phosphoglucomutase n=1 Tax=Candidatus Scalindua rubra TaxID=1872076 RepID=A0A1E3XB55_9BACT|nr:MAG: beta-phosphoglucomutase [Candidatus Scalindua rubra]
MSIKGVIFDLDGVIVSTDEYHYQGWQRLADEERIYFDREINERLRGVSRMESLEIILEKSDRVYSQDEKIKLAERKNNYYRELLKKITPDDILPGVRNVLEELKRRSIKIAIGSSSKNSPTILERIGLDTCFDATSDGNDIKNSKPDPEVFLIAAKRLSLSPEECLVVEDAGAGVEAGITSGMRVLAVGSAKDDKRAHISAKDMDSITVDEMLDV